MMCSQAHWDRLACMQSWCTISLLALLEIPHTERMSMHAWHWPSAMHAFQIKLHHQQITFHPFCRAADRGSDRHGDGQHESPAALGGHSTCRSLCQLPTRRGALQPCTGYGLCSSCHHREHFAVNRDRDGQWTAGHMGLNPMLSIILSCPLAHWSCACRAWLSKQQSLQLLVPLQPSSPLNNPLRTISHPHLPKLMGPRVRRGAAPHPW